MKKNFWDWEFSPGYNTLQESLKEIESDPDGTSEMEKEIKEQNGSKSVSRENGNGGQ